MLCALLAASAGCQSRSPSRGLSPEIDVRAQWTRDSARFVLDSIQWERDVRVRDSISRSINTDTLYWIYRAMLAKPDPELFARAHCVTSGIAYVYGSVPGLAAVKRMTDTVWKPGEAEAVRRMENRFENMTVPERMMQSVNPAKCHWGRLSDSLVDGTPVDYIRSRPIRPKPPTP